MKSLVHREDWSLLLLLGLFLICLSSANTFIQICGDVLFISNLGVGKLPFMYIVSAVVLAIIALAIIPVIDRLERTKIYNLTAGSLALGLIFCRLLTVFNFKWIYYGIYVSTYILESILFLEFWLMASDVCPTRQAKRIFPVILGLSLTSGTITAFLTRPLAQSIHTENLLLVCSLLCGITIIFSQMISRFLPGRRMARVEKEPKEISNLKRLQLDLRIVWQSKLARVISFCFILYTVLSFILDYKFNQIMSLHFTVGGEINTDRLTAFYGQIKGCIAIASLALQFFLAGHLINRLGVCQTYLLMPFVFFLGFLGIPAAQLVQKGFYAALSARFGHKTVAGSLYRSSGELLYNAIPNEKRGRVRAFHTAVMEPLGVALAGGVIMLVKMQAVSVAIGLSLVYLIIVGLSLKKNYIASLINMLKEKSGGLRESLSGPFGRYGSKEILSHLAEALEDKDPHVRIFVVEILGDLREKNIFFLLASHYLRENDNQVKARILQILGEGRYKEARPLYEGALKDSDPYVRKIALESLGNTGDKEILTTISPFLNDPDFVVQAQAIVSSWELGGVKEYLKDRMACLFKNENKNAKLAAIELAGKIPLPENLNYLLDSLNQDSPVLRRGAIKALGKTGKAQAATYLVKRLERRDNRLNPFISATLAEMGKVAEAAVRDALASADIYSRHFLLKTLKAVNKKESKVLTEGISKDIRQCYYNLYLILKLKAFSHKKATLLLEDALLEENRKAQFNALTTLKILDGHSERMDIISRNIRHPDTFVRGNALEALENIGETTITAPLIGLLEERELEEEAPPWPKRFGFPELTASQVLEELLISNHSWLRATAIFSIGELKLTEFKQRLLHFLEESDELIRANTVEALTKLG